VSSSRYPTDEIRMKCDLVEIISAHVALRKSGRTFIGLCPFHNEKTPSFHVNPERGFWKCFGCGEGGDVFDFVRRIDNLTFPEAVEQLARKYGVTIERSEQAVREYSEKERLLRANNIACAFYRSMLGKSDKAREYIAKRGISADVVERYRLGYAPEGWDALLNHLREQKILPADAVKAGLIVPRGSSQGFYDRFRDRLIFPILDSSERVIAFGGRTFGDEQPKYLNSPETPLFMKNRTLYGLNVARKSLSTEGQLIVVEGYMDVITMQSAGFENTVATLGTALTEEHVNVISRFTKNVVLSFDADSAGMKAALRSAPLFERAGFNVRILSMPKGEDPDSMLRGGDATRFASLLEKTLPIPDFRIKLAFSQYDLNSDEGKTGALKEAINVLAEVESAIERERLIKNLAKYHPNFSTGTTLAEDHLRREIGKLRSRMTHRGTPELLDTRDRSEAKKQPANDLSLVERAERLVLGIILFHRVDASKVFNMLPPKEFTGSDTSSLAEVLSRQHLELGKIDEEDLRSRIEGTPAESLLIDLLMGLDDSDLQSPVEDLVQTILNCRKRERVARMRSLADKFKQGLIGKGDEEFEEYWRLQRELKGNNAPRVLRRNTSDD